MQIETNETQEVINIPNNDGSVYDAVDVGNFGGYGILGAFLILGGLLFANWKINGTRSIGKRLEKYEDKKDLASSTITVNQRKQETLKIVVEQKERLADDTQKKIEQVVSNAADEIKQVLKEKNPKVTVNHIISNWKGKPKGK